MKLIELDPISRHEVMDRASTILEILGGLLGDHPGMANGKLREIYERAGDVLSDLYQEAGRISFVGCQQTTDTEIVDFLASFWDSQGEGGEILGRKFDNPTGSFRDAVTVHMQVQGRKFSGFCSNHREAGNFECNVCYPFKK